jgi:hypothetical protein
MSQKLQSYDHLQAYLEGEFSDEVLLANIDSSDPSKVLFLTEQMSLKRGLKAFGKAGTDAVVKEMRQLDQMKRIIPRAVSELWYLMYLKKWNGTIKVHGCADGHPRDCTR